MSIPYKYRGILQLSLLVVALPWCAWRFALRGTFGTWRDCRRLAVRLETLAPVTPHPAAVGTEDRELILSGGLLDSVRRAALLQAVQVVGYEPRVTEERDGVAVHTAQLTLTGSYIPLLRVVDALDRTLPNCRVRTLGWQTAIDRPTRNRQLILTLYIEQAVLKNQP